LSAAAFSLLALMCASSACSMCAVIACTPYMRHRPSPDPAAALTCCQNTPCFFGCRSALDHNSIACGRHCKESSVHSTNNSKAPAYKRGPSQERHPSADSHPESRWAASPSHAALLSHPRTRAMCERYRP
jgi:hypothetical protein